MAKSNSQPDESRFFGLLENLGRYHVTILLSLSILTRIRAFFDSDAVILGWRQADMASIAMNYLNYGFRFLYPQVYWGGNGPGYVEMEFPLIPFLTALLFKWFGVHDWLAMVIPFACGVGTVLALYMLVKRVYDPPTGLIAGLVAAASPMFAFYSQTFVSETALIFLSVFGMHKFVCWLEDERWMDFYFAALSIALAILLKLTALYLGFPILFLCLQKFGRAFLKEQKVWIFALLVLAPSALWYFHANILYREFHNTFGILSGGYNKFARIDLLINPDFYTLVTGRIIFYILTPFGFLFFLYGLLQRRMEDYADLFHWWAASIVLYLFVVAEGNKDMNYYQLPLLPVGAALAGVGCIAFMRKVERLPVVRNPQRFLHILNFAIILFVFNAVGASMLFTLRSEVKVVQLAESKRNIGRLVGQVTESGSLIIASDSYGNPKTPEQIDTPPEVFYFSDRRGWYLAVSWLNMTVIDSLRGEGARYLVVSGSADVTEFKSNKLLYRDLSARNEPVVESEECVVFDLRSR